MDQNSAEDGEITGIHELVRSDLALTLLCEDNHPDKRELVKIIQSAGITNGSLDSIPQTASKVFEALDEWRGNIRNIVF